MAGTVSGISCDVVRGDAQGKMTRVELWQMAGLDGYGAIDLGLGDGRGQFEVHKLGTIVAVNAWITLINALKGGNPITIVNDWAVTFANFEITEISQPEITVAEPYNAHAVLVIGGVLV